jgi:hypothetical protein
VVIVFDATSPVTAMRKFATSGDRTRQSYNAGQWLEHFVRLVNRQQVVVFMWQTSHVGSPLNEFADYLADLALKESVVPVPRGLVEFEAVRWSGARRGGLHAWARPRSQQVIQSWLAQSALETPVRDGSELRLAALPGRVARWADRVLSARAQVGDQRLRRQMGDRCFDCDVVCPFGCLMSDGLAEGEQGPRRRAPCTWWHVQFVCPCVGLVEARDTWSRTIDAAWEAMRSEGRSSEGEAHPQLWAARSLLDGGFTDEPDGGSLRLVRQLLGNAVSPTRGKGGSREAKHWAWRVMVSGLELQVRVDELAKGFSSGVQKLVKSRRFMASHLRAWRLLVLRGGPARAAVLAGASTARDAVCLATCSTVVPGLGGVQSLVHRATAAWGPLALAGSLTDAPTTACWLRVWFLRLALCTRESRRARLQPAGTEVGCFASREVACISWSALGFGVAVPWEAGGVAGRRWMVEGVWRAVKLERGIRHAWRAWAVAGGVKAMALERGRLRGAEETRRAARLLSFVEQRGLQPDPMLAALGNARRSLHQRAPARRRMLRNQEVIHGVAPDGRGRWAVEGILEWRDGTTEREALVRWCGFDPDTGRPWDDSWEPRSWLTSDLRAGGVIRRRRTAAQIRGDDRREMEDWDERHTHTRKSRRLQGEDPEEENIGST